MTDTPQRPAPRPAGSAEPYWDAASEGRITVPYCGECGHVAQYGRPFCEVCLAAPVCWRQVPGTGRIHSFTVVRRSRDPFFAGRVPYVVAIVELDAGVRLLTGIVGADPGDVRIDMPVRVCFEKTGSGPVPLFEPATG